MGSPAAVLVPVKGFAVAKARLAPALGADDRRALARELADVVLAAAAPLPVLVVCDDDEVAAWADEAGARVLRVEPRGLDAAVTEGVDALAAAGVARVVVAHADLPRAAGLAGLAGTAGDPVTLVPDRAEDGTNVAVVPSAAGFRFAYGPGSFRRHVAEAARLGLGPRVVRRADLAWDVDVPADLPIRTESPCS
jgi:2-phospho-L-lactate/phosphoenolpyruvate guanylyltransferase